MKSVEFYSRQNTIPTQRQLLKRLKSILTKYHYLGRDQINHCDEYQTDSKKAKLHFGFDLNHGIPRKLFLTEGNGAERPFVSRIIDPDQTGVLDRGYQAHHLFDQWQQNGCHFVCRIQESRHKEIREEFPVKENSHVFFDAMILLRTPKVNQTKKPFHLVGYNIERKS